MATANTPAAAGSAKTKSFDKRKLAILNSVAIAVSAFGGSILSLSAISDFTKKWALYVPYIGRFFENNPAGKIGYAFLLLGLAIFGIATVAKLTDLDGTKKSWCVISKVFLFIAIICGIEFISTMLYSLLAVGVKNFGQGDLWLNGGLNQAIVGGAATGMFFMSKAIANGKVNIIKVLSIVAISVASLALVLVIIADCVSFYSHGYSDYYYSNYEKIRDR